MRKLTHTNNAQIFSTRDVADQLGTEEWKVRRLFEDGLLDEPVRFAGKRVIRGDQLPAIVDAMRLRGWLVISCLGDSTQDCSEQAVCDKKQEACDE